MLLPRFLALPPALLLLVGVSIPAAAQTLVTWGGDGGDWETAALWSPSVVPSNGEPAPGDTYNVAISSGQVALNAAVTVNQVSLSGGTLALNQGDPFGVDGGFDWSGGTLRGGYGVGALSIGSGGSSTWSGTLLMDEAQVINAGAVTLADGVALTLNAVNYGETARGLRNLAGATITLAGAGSWQGSWYGEGATPDSFNNLGTVVKNGAGTFTFGFGGDGSSAAPFQNAGTVTVNGGQLRLNVPVPSTSGNWTVASGAQLVFGDTLSTTSAAVFAGAGTVEFRSSGTFSGTYGVTGTTRLSGLTTVNFDTSGATAFATLELVGGANLGGTGALSATQALTWSGTIQGTSTAQTFALSSGASGTSVFDESFELSARTFNHSGSFTWLGGTTTADSTFRFGSSAVFNNLSGATFTAAGNGRGGVPTNSSTMSGTFVNAGTFAKTGAGTTTQLNWNFQNSGLVDVQSGRLELASLGTAGGSYQVASGGQLLLRRASIESDFSGNYSLTAGGQLEFSQGHLQPTASFATGHGTVVIANNTRISRDTLAADLVKFTGSNRLSPPSGNLTLAHVELIAGGTIGLSASDRLIVSESLAWSGGSVSTPVGFLGFTAGTLELAPGASGTVSGAVSLANSATLHQRGSLTVNAGASLQVGPGSTLLNSSNIVLASNATLRMTPSTTAAQDATLNGGNVTGSGRLLIDAGRNAIGGMSYATLNGASFNGTVELAANRSFLRLTNGATVTGNVNFTAANVTGSGNFTSFELHQGGTLDHVVLQDTSANTSASATFAVIGAHTVTVGANSTLRNLSTIAGDLVNASTGEIIETGAATLINQGRIVSNVAGKATNLSNLTTFENQGSLEASNGGAITSDRPFTQTAGKVLIGSGSSFTMSASGNSTRLLTITGGTLEGTGTFNGSLALAGGTIAPGTSPGLLTIVGDLAASSGQFKFELGGLTRGTGYDAIDLSGALTLSGAGPTLQISFLNDFASTVQPTDTFTVIDYGTLSGSFAAAPSGSRILTADGAGSFEIFYGAGSAFDPGAVVLTNFSAVPEPSTYAAIAGLVGLGTAWWRRRHGSHLSARRG